jgi:hypothetical protein
MWHRRRGEKAAPDRAGKSDPLSTVIWEEGHLTGSAVKPPVINAPRAGDLAPSGA